MNVRIGISLEFIIYHTRGIVEINGEYSGYRRHKKVNIRGIGDLNGEYPINVNKHNRWVGFVYMKTVHTKNM